MRKLIMTLFLFGTLVSYGQKVESYYFNHKDTLSDFYVLIRPSSAVKGFMFLVPSLGESPKNVLSQTQLPVYAASQGIMVFIPIFKTGPYNLGIDSSTQQSFIEMVNFVVEKYRLQDLKFFVGGFSIGGTCAVKFAENLAQAGKIPKLNAIFAIDPPLDFERVYNAYKRQIRISKEQRPSQEAVFLITSIERLMNGSPIEAKQNYYKLSPYSISDSSQSAISTLKNIPIMLYTEPDIQWQLNERGSDYYLINAFDCAAMINELKRAGNKKAVLVVTENKGFRQPNMMRHPHSWSIADPTSLVKWLFDQP